MIAWEGEMGRNKGQKPGKRRHRSRWHPTSGAVPKGALCELPFRVGRLRRASASENKKLTRLFLGQGKGTGRSFQGQKFASHGWRQGGPARARRVSQGGRRRGCRVDGSSPGGFCPTAQSGGGGPKTRKQHWEGKDAVFVEGSRVRTREESYFLFRGHWGRSG